VQRLDPAAAHHLGLVRELKSFAPDITVILHGNDPDIVPLGFLGGSRFIVRIPTTGTRYAFLLSNREREADRSTIDGWHYVDNRLRVLDTLGIAPASRAPRIHLDAGLRERTAAKIRVSWSSRPSSAETLVGWLARPARCSAANSTSPERSPVNTRPVRLPPCAAGARPRIAMRASGGPKPGTGRPQ